VRRSHLRGRPSRPFCATAWVPYLQVAAVDRGKAVVFPVRWHTSLAEERHIINEQAPPSARAGQALITVDFGKPVKFPLIPCNFMQITLLRASLLFV
jgi:hypothetical protein